MAPMAEHRRIWIHGNTLGRLLVPLVFLGAGAGCGGATPHPSSDLGPRPNFVLVISDDQDYEHFGFMGSTSAKTPSLDRLADEGVVFRSAYVPSSRCRPSLASLLSGRWPHQNGVATNKGGPRLDPTASLPRLLHDAGYATYLGGKFWEGAIEPFGFDERQHADKHNFVRHGQAGLFRFLEQVANKQPFFVWWAPMLPHLPHDPPQEYLDLFDPSSLSAPPTVPHRRIEEYKHAEHLSLAMEAWLDEGLAELRTKLESEGLLANTMFIFLIDNGYANGFASKGSAYEKGLRTPIIFSQAGRQLGSAGAGALVSSLDIYPTILELAGLGVPEQAAGRSLKAWLDGGSGPGRDALYGLQYEKALHSDESVLDTAIALYAREGHWKYILYLQDMPRARQRTETAFSAIKIREWKRGQEEFFDLQADPHELNSLHADPAQRARMQRMRAGAEAWLNETGAGALELP